MTDVEIAKKAEPHLEPGLIGDLDTNADAKTAPSPDLHIDPSEPDVDGVEDDGAEDNVPVATVLPPTVALVGRPNVGKSTIFNRLVGRRLALVNDRPGVTRDRMIGEAVCDGALINLVDTGGMFPPGNEPLLEDVHKQAEAAIAAADLVLLVVDAAAGIQPMDHTIAQILRKAGKSTVVVANKVDIPEHDARVLDCYELSLGPVVGFSAEHARGLDELWEHILGEVTPVPAKTWQARWAAMAVDEEDLPEGMTSRIEWSGGPVRVAILGRPNAGKSSLVNRLLGEERLITSDLAGTTRDAIDTTLSVEDQTYVLVDTAGMRRQRSIRSRLERFAVMQATRALERSDVAVLVVDATDAPAQQDARIVQAIQDRGKGLVLWINKWDALENTEQGAAFVEHLKRTLRFVPYATILRGSAKTGRGLRRLLPAVLAAHQERHRRVATRELNRFLAETTTGAGVVPPGAPKIYFVSQPMVRPPTFVFACSAPRGGGKRNTAGIGRGGMPESHVRFLERRLRQAYGFEGTPLWLKFRLREKRSSAE